MYQQLPLLYVYDSLIEPVSTYKYVGIHFSSVHHYIFQNHYIIKASKAREVTSATFAIESLSNKFVVLLFKGLRS